MRRARLLSFTILAAALGVLPIVVLDRVHAAGAELMGAWGEPLSAYAGESHDDGVRTLIVNGARLELQSGRTADGIDAVLDALAKLCRPEGDALNPVVRTRRADQGVVGCIVPRAGRSLATDLRVFAETQDLSALGELRVTWAMRDGDGTRYVAIAAHGPLDLARSFPADTDAPGADLPDLPRPPEARRVLSTWQDGADPLILSYRSTLRLDALEARYEAALSATCEQLDRVPGAPSSPRVLAVRRGGRRYLTVLAADGDGTLISIIPLAGDATAAQGAR